MSGAREMKFRLASRLMLGCTLFSLSLLSSSGEALCQAQGSKLSSDNIVTRQMVLDAFCSDNGKLAECAGRSGSECSKMVKPLLDRCLPSGDKIKATVVNDLYFQRCFWTPFNKSYGKNFRYTPECFSPAKDGDPLQALPPELQGQMQEMDTLKDLQIESDKKAGF
jgi:hypothetical protein